MLSMQIITINGQLIKLRKVHQMAIKLILEVLRQPVLVIHKEQMKI